MQAVERGREMKRLRKAANLTQYEVGERVGVKAQAVSAWERGENDPSWQRLRALDEAYGAGGELLALFGDERLLSQLDALGARIEGLARHLASVLRVVRQLQALGVDTSGLPSDEDVLRPALP